MKRNLVEEVGHIDGRGKGRVDDRVVVAQDLHGKPGRAERITLGDGVGACWVEAGRDELAMTSAGARSSVEELDWQEGGHPSDVEVVGVLVGDWSDHATMRASTAGVTLLWGRIGL